MADTKITALTALTAADPANDVIPIVDVSDTTMAASGTTKKISVNNILGASGTATLASATITGDLTVDTSTLKVDSANNRVGIVQATPLYPLHLVGEFGLQEESAGNGSKLRFIGQASQYNFRLGKQLTATNAFEITPSTAPGGTTFSNPVYTVTYDGTHTFLDGAGGTRMTLNSTGLGVGVVPRAKLDVNGGLLVNNYPTSNNYAPLSVKTTAGITTPSTFTNAINIWNTTNVGDYSNITFGYNALGITNAPAYIGFVSTSSASFGFGDLVFGTRDVGTDTAATERVRIDASGNLLVGTPSLIFGSASGSLNIAAANTQQFIIRHTGSAAGEFWRQAVDPVNTFYILNNATAGVSIASGATSWSAVSDERLKDIIEPISNAIEKVGSLRSVIGKYKNDETNIRRSFLIAQDVQSVLPEAVDSSKPNELGLRYTEVIPLLVAAIKELTARVQTLEAR
jgi:hypothetical protein